MNNIYTFQFGETHFPNNKIARTHPRYKGNKYSTSKIQCYELGLENNK
jgi:hypothetical protein